tara:strand:- start:505 stop:1407 length:903 start_codon:yes stop_codon:yes gene_type:complete
MAFSFFQTSKASKPSKPNKIKFGSDYELKKREETEEFYKEACEINPYFGEYLNLEHRLMKATDDKQVIEGISKDYIFNCTWAPEEMREEKEQIKTKLIAYFRKVTRFSELSQDFSKDIKDCRQRLEKLIPIRKEKGSNVGITIMYPKRINSKDGTICSNSEDCTESVDPHKHQSDFCKFLYFKMTMYNLVKGDKNKENIIKHTFNLADNENEKLRNIFGGSDSILREKLGLRTLSGFFYILSENLNTPEKIYYKKRAAQQVAIAVKQSLGRKSKKKKVKKGNKGRKASNLRRKASNLRQK